MARIRPQSFWFTLLLSAFGGITPLSVDMNLPALGVIGGSLHVPAAEAGLMLSFFLIGFSLGPLVIGPVSDGYGRRPVLLVGTALFVVASLGCQFAPTLPVMLAWRFVEGIGAAAGSVLSLAIVRDHFDGATARVRLSYVTTVGMVAPMIAPTLGGWVAAAWGWRSIYGFLTVGGVLLMAAILFGFEESIPRRDPEALRPARLLANYRRFLSNRVCLGYALVALFTFGSLFSYVASSPLILIGLLGVSTATYGWAFATTSFGIMIGAFANARLSARGVAPSRLMATGLGVSVMATAGVLGLALAQQIQLSTLLPLVVLNMTAAGIILPNASQGALHPMPEIAGVASGILLCLRMLAGSVASVVVSLFFDGHSAVIMGLTMCGFSCASFLAYFFGVRQGPEDEAIEP